MKAYVRKKYGNKCCEFYPMNKEKYKGTLPIQSRSSWEFKFMCYCDLTPAILKWGSESVIVMYNDPTRNNTEHRYYVDFNITVKNKDGELDTYLIEVKPYKETIVPTNSPNKKKENYTNECITYARNVAKWEAAKLAVKKRGMKFLILTEKQLYPAKKGASK